MRVLSLLLFLLLVNPSAGETLSESAQRLADSSLELHQQLKRPEPTWGHQQALDDLERFATASRELAGELAKGVEADQNPETVLGSARRRLETSKVMLNAEPGQLSLLEENLSRAAALEEEIRAYRLRFNGQAGADLSMVEAAGPVGPAHYENPQALLVEVRCVRDLTLQLRASFFAAGGPGSGQPNNLDTMRLRELALEARKLERTLQITGIDVRDSIEQWEKLRRAYNRVGYIPPSVPGRQLEFSMKRLQAFYDSLVSSSPATSP